MYANTISVRNVAEALPAGLRYLAEWGALQKSRAGDVVCAPGPTTTVYSHPWECVLTSRIRDANPFFHLAEVVWMLAGRDDVGFLTPYVKTFSKYAEEDGTVHGAYGHRWRKTFGYDQLPVIVDKLRADPTTRQCVLQMWDARDEHEDPWGQTCKTDDLRGNFQDRPCNTHVYFRVRRGHLDMTVCCRSNDIIMGAYGANAVHFSFLHQYVAAAAGYRVGSYAQFSHDYHAYVADINRLWKRKHPEDGKLDVLRELSSPRKWAVLSGIADGVTDLRSFFPEPEAVTHPDHFLLDVEKVAAWVADTHADGTATFPVVINQFLTTVVRPAMTSHWLWRRGEATEAGLVASSIQSPSWRTACTEWLQRRAKK